LPRGVFDKALAAQAKAFGVRSPKYRQPVWHAWGAKALLKRSVLRLMERQEQILVGNPRPDYARGPSGDTRGHGRGARRSSVFLALSHMAPLFVGAFVFY
jgi:hypothetical protein